MTILLSNKYYDGDLLRTSRNLVINSSQCNHGNLASVRIFILILFPPVKYLPLSSRSDKNA